MSYRPDCTEWIRAYSLARKIDECNDLLGGKSVRAFLHPDEKARMVQIQNEKAMLVEELKLHVRHFPHVPQVILEKIFPS
uniref:AsIV-cont00013-ORF2 n=1 Tax=Apophua simplicipes ichnovirus TaxID=1329648 RepID=S5DYS1_9VIRU|nr:AsIV-cont00013-ORF2 [Apophua simplicipes ichnovirus]